MIKINEEHDQTSEGNPINLEVETAKGTFEMQVTCPVCGGVKYWLSEDHEILYCSKCRTPIAERFKDHVIEKDITWGV